ncbi:uncharacterized protein LOC114259492 isoform X2 [Camellia sinensis]|uniref:uncharacterized protein LOC114259492 isoform X1 n=1 Tax=Camellia sinensis TaxID=4442 RepID=UPI0010359BFB|nr:uncharacterized protein LOC114259492 isoform X1 [Camellia sinensis]XP_028055402.1 uncharacterized protein LOC114259492 isoform X1 [Camellia sinensis]XP_028055457.1 uncharacterized protein LOC114259492 isoform X2 [Camellia sinensis]
MAEEDLLQDNRIEDVCWLCSLSESELDMLSSLKMLVLRRAKVIGHEALAKKFDLKMLRVLSFILMEHLKGELKDSSVIPSLVESSTFLDRCNLLNCNPNGSFGNMSIEELRAYVGSDKRKRMAELFSEDGAPNQKMKPNAKSKLVK